jgi:hypothetical protein
MISRIKILRWLSKGDKQWFQRDIDYSMNLLNSFDEPIDLWQRSYYQFKCNCFDFPYWKRFLYSIAAIIMLPFSLIYFRLSHFNTHFISKEECVGDCASVPEMVPESLKEKYNIKDDVFFAGYGLSHSDVIYLCRHIGPYLLSPSFVLHIIFKIAAYSNIFHKYQPSVIICHNEYSYSSSALTDYCRYHNVTHINFMHGERLINIRNAFFEYDKCYVWHDHYKQIYLDLRSGTLPDNFVIELPKALKIDINKNYSEKEFANYKYYFAKGTYEEIDSIVRSLKPLKDNGYKIKYRPHPRYTDLNILKTLVPPEEIESPMQVSISTSVASCDYVIGSYSTVLLQAFLCGKGVLIDDVTYGDRIEQQKKARHILLSVEGPELLSSHLNRNIQA